MAEVVTGVPVATPGGQPAAGTDPSHRHGADRATIDSTPASTIETTISAADISTVLSVPGSRHAEPGTREASPHAPGRCGASRFSGLKRPRRSRRAAAT